MSCTTFRKRILDLAVAESTSGDDDRNVGLAARDPLLAAHLESCAGCREALASRRAVLGAIDRVLTDELREEPSPLLAAQVRQKIDSMEVPSSAWRSLRITRWVPIAAAGVLALALILMMRGLLSVGGSGESRVIDPVAAIGKVPEVAHPPSHSAGRTTSPSTATRRNATTEARPTPSLRPSTANHRVATIDQATLTFPEVIVPAGELRAAVQFSEASARHPLSVAEVGSDRPDGDDHLQPVDALAIEKIEIKPLVLEPVDGGAPEPANPVNL